MPHRQGGADFEQGLAVAHRQFVEDETPCLIVESSEDIDQNAL